MGLSGVILFILNPPFYIFVVYIVDACLFSHLFNSYCPFFWASFLLHLSHSFLTCLTQTAKSVYFMSLPRFFLAANCSCFSLTPRVLPACVVIVVRQGFGQTLYSDLGAYLLSGFLALWVPPRFLVVFPVPSWAPAVRAWALYILGKHLVKGTRNSDLSPKTILSCKRQHPNLISACLFSWISSGLPYTFII